MTVKKTLVPRIEEFVLSEANGFLSREEVTVTLQPTVTKSGTVMSQLTATGKWVPYDDAGTDGTEMAVMFVRDCEVVRAALTGLNANAEADLTAKGIRVRGKATTK
jgi:Bacteriophage lambda head decoration protein D